MAIDNAADDEIMDIKVNPGLVSEKAIAGRVKVTAINKAKAPLKETSLKVLLEITGAEMGKLRLGVDIVTVLDVTGLDENEKNLDEAKTAMKFLINKLSDIDRLSVVTISRTDNAKMITPLLRMTENSKERIESLLTDKLPVVDVSENHASQRAADAVSAGLQTAVQVLKDHKLERRVPAILLVMCTSDEPQSGHVQAVKVPHCDFPVHTFGLGSKYDEKILYEIATKSPGGTFSMADDKDTPWSSNLSIAFSQCLAGLLTVVQDLKLTITRNTDNTKGIQKVSAGDYLKAKDHYANSVEISFGNLYCKEKRKVIVDLLLPSVARPLDTEVLKISYSYKIGKTEFREPKDLLASVTRTTETLKEHELEEVTIEEAYIQTVDMMKEATHIAENGNLDKAQDIIVEAQNMLEDMVHKPNPTINTLKYDMWELIRLMQTKEIYQSRGSAVALAAQSSHDRQRFVASGEVNENVPRFVTSVAYLEQVKSFVKNPSMALSTISDDMAKEIAKNPIAAIPGAVEYYLGILIQSLEAIQKEVNTYR